MYELFKLGLDCCVDLIIIVTFILGFETLRYRCSETTRNLYIENYKKVQKVLDNIIRTGEATAEDINSIAIAYNDADLYLSKDISKYTKDMWQTIVQYHLLLKSNDKDEQKLIQILKKIGNFKTDKTVSLYKKHIVRW